MQEPSCPSTILFYCDPCASSGAQVAAKFGGAFLWRLFYSRVGHAHDSRGSPCMMEDMRRPQTPDVTPEAAPRAGLCAGDEITRSAASARRPGVALCINGGHS